MKRLTTFVLVALWVAFSSGCLGASEPDSAILPSEGPRTRPTVIALIDSGINPYHIAFQAAPGGTSVETFADLPADATRVSLAKEGDFVARMEEDEEFWSSVEVGSLYAFEGTRVMAVSISHVGLPLEDVEGHGTGMASLAAREDPDAIIVMVQVNGVLCHVNAAPEECPIFPNVVPALRWVAGQSWIDVVSISQGIPANPPSVLIPESEEYASLLAQIQASGRLVVNGAGNTVVPPLMGQFAGPPSVIAVGGAEPTPRGEAPAAAKVVDVVANYTDYVAAVDSVDGYFVNRGTSLATPIVAGALSRAIHEVRAAMGHQGGVTAQAAFAAQGDRVVTSKDFRDALNATAVYFAATDWDPTQPATNSSELENLLATSAPVLVPSVQMGWGYVHGGMASEIARRVLEGDLSPPPGKEVAARQQAAYQAAREAYWGHG